MNIRYYEGRRIYLRPIEMSDEPQLRRWINDPANWRTLDRFLPVNELREREFIEGLYKSADSLAVGIVVREGDLCLPNIPSSLRHNDLRASRSPARSAMMVPHRTQTEA